jgi:hypothetical protein
VLWLQNIFTTFPIYDPMKPKNLLLKVSDRSFYHSDTAQIQSNRNNDLARTITAFEAHANNNALHPNPSSRHVKKSSLDFKYDELNKSSVPSPE